MFTIHLRAEAQKLLSNLTEAQRNDFEKIKSVCQIGMTQKKKRSHTDVSLDISDVKRALLPQTMAIRKLAQKAYPDLTLDQLEVHVIDQFINGLGHRELQKHVQFRHPRTLHEAIGLATEYEALEGSLDRVNKPPNEETTVAPIVGSSTCKKESQGYPNITLDQISKLIDTKLDKLLPRNESRDKSLINQRDSSSSRKTEYFRSRSPEPKSNPKSPIRTRKRLYCTLCKRNIHSTENCYFRQNEESNTSYKETEQQYDNAVTSNDNSKSCTVSTVIVEASVNANQTDTKSFQETVKTSKCLNCKHQTVAAETECKQETQSKANQDKAETYEPGHEKMCLMSYANNKGADQSAHSRSLINAFVVRCLDSIIPLVSIAEISRL